MGYLYFGRVSQEPRHKRDRAAGRRCAYCERWLKDDDSRFPLGETGQTVHCQACHKYHQWRAEMLAKRLAVEVA